MPKASAAKKADMAKDKKLGIKEGSSKDKKRDKKIKGYWFMDELNKELTGYADYGVPMGTPNDPKSHPAYNMPKSSKTGLGLIPIGPNHDLGDE